MDACPKCGDYHLVKDGIVGGRQRYLCKACGCPPSVVHKSGNLTVEEKEMVAGMRREGLGFRAIGRVLRASHVTILKQVRNHGLNPTQAIFQPEVMDGGGVHQKSLP